MKPRVLLHQLSVEKALAELGRPDEQREYDACTVLTYGRRGLRIKADGECFVMDRDDGVVLTALTAGLSTMIDLVRR